MGVWRAVSKPHDVWRNLIDFFAFENDTQYRYSEEMQQTDLVAMRGFNFCF